MSIVSGRRLEAFCLELAKGSTATEAARVAGYTGTSLDRNASKRAAKPHIRARIAELQANMAKAAAIDSAKLIDWAVDARLMAIELKRPGDVLHAIETIAKLCGLWKEKVDTANQFNGPVTFEVHYTREGGERRVIDVTPGPRVVPQEIADDTEASDIKDLGA
jgi:Terminase small subunit